MSSQYIPAEFKGLAREFRRQVDAGDEAYTSAVNRIKRTLHARLVRKPTLRAGMVIDIEREFRALANPVPPQT